MCTVMLALAVKTYFAVFLKMVTDKYGCLCVRLAQLVHLTLFTQTKQSFFQAVQTRSSHLASSTQSWQLLPDATVSLHNE